MKIKPAKTPKPEPRQPTAAGRVKVNTYYGSRERDVRATSTASPFERRQLKKSYKKLFAPFIDYIFLILLFGGIAYSLSVSPTANISATSDIYHPVAAYKTFIDQRLHQLKDFNKISFDEAGLASDIKTKFPEVKAVSVELPIATRQPLIHLDVGKPAFFISSGGHQYLVSSNGIAVGERSSYKNVGTLSIVEDDSGFFITPGRPILSSQDVSFIETVIAEVQARHVPLKKIVLPNIPEEVDLYTADANYFTKFFTGGDATLQAGQYLAARSDLADAPPSQYLDVRVAGKIFYK